MPLANQHRKRIEQYCDKRDRGREPVFVGREDLFRLVASNARAAAGGDVEGRTVCIAGPPGIGKTAFLSELRKRAKAVADGWSGPPTACIDIGPDELHSPPHVLAAIASQLPKEWRPSLDAVKGALAGLGAVGVSLGAAGIEFSASASFDRESPKAKRMPWPELPRAIGRMPSGAALCLMVDEAHTLDSTPGQDRNRLLQSLHMGPPPMRDSAPPPPVFAVLAGHTQTPEVLETSTSQRYATGNLRYMESLSRDESLSYVLGTLRHLQEDGLDPGGKAVAYWATEECGGFPHHLRNAMESIAEGMLRTNSTRLADLDGAVIAYELGMRRALYYEARTEGTLSAIGTQLGALLRDWSRRTRPVKREDGEDALDELLETLPPNRRQRMAKAGIADGEDLMREMIRKGAVMTDSEGGCCRCPIDSLISWMESGSHVGRSSFPSLAAHPTTGRGAAPVP